MRSGSRVVLAFVAAAGVALAVFLLYGGRVVDDRAVATPLSAVREAVLADNTVVGRLGPVREVALVEMRPGEPADSTLALAADVVGARSRGRLYADLERADGRWRVVRASFVTFDGERLPVGEDGPGSLDPGGATSGAERRNPWGAR